MSFMESKLPWYVAGLAFECSQCGRCCAGPDEGYVWVSETDLAMIAQFLGAGVEQVRGKYTRRCMGRTSLLEHPVTHDCVFLTPSGCSIYEARPMQCRTWPFWPGNLASPRAWSQAAGRCCGINRGPLHPFEEIQAKRQATED